MIKEIDPYELQDGLSDEKFISLLNIYLKEFIHRDQILWSQISKIYYSTILVTLFPSLSKSIMNFELKSFGFIFPIFGFFMTYMFAFIAIEYSLRLKCATRTYNKLLSQIKKNKYTRVKLNMLRECRCSKIDMCIYNSINECTEKEDIQKLGNKYSKKIFQLIPPIYKRHIGETTVHLLILSLIILCIFSLLYEIFK